MSSSHPTSDHSLPWEILNLISPYLDPKTLAIASCVNKTWSISLSSDHIWKPLCFTHYPSLSILHLTHPTKSYRHLYTLCHLSSLPHRTPRSFPQISISEIFFTIDVFNGNSHIFSITKAGEDLHSDPNSLFRFDFDVRCKDKSVVLGTSDELRVRWSIVLQGWRGVFMVMDCKGKGRLLLGYGRWFSEELPSIGCCSKSETSGIVAELGFRLCNYEGDAKMMKIEKVTVSFLSVASWRYTKVDDALRYLQHFLLPSHV